MNDFEIMRFLAAIDVDKEVSLVDKLSKMFDYNNDLTPYNISSKVYENRYGARDYAIKRGISKDTYDFFELGYLDGFMVIPIKSHKGTTVGQVGRSTEGKTFLYSKGLKVGKVLFNMNNAKTYSVGIVVESSIDVLKMHSLGYKNVVATLGGSIPDYKMNLLNSYFEKVIVMTDFDKTGRRMGRQIESGFNRDVYYASGRDMVYPYGCKDPGDMTPEQIKKLLDNPMTSYEYQELHGNIDFENK